MLDMIQKDHLHGGICWVAAQLPCSHYHNVETPWQEKEEEIEERKKEAQFAQPLEAW